jgi:hypothetical protein
MNIHKLLSVILFSFTLFLAGNLTNVLAEDEIDEDLAKAAEEYNQTQNEKRKVICKKEAPIGSRIKKKVCRSVASIERDEKEGNRYLKRRRITSGQQQ